MVIFILLCNASKGFMKPLCGDKNLKYFFSLLMGIERVKNSRAQSVSSNNTNSATIYDIFNKFVIWKLNIRYPAFRNKRYEFWC